VTDGKTVKAQLFAMNPENSLAVYFASLQKAMN
jgi:hypothetical protein